MGRRRLRKLEFVPFFRNGEVKGYRTTYRIKGGHKYRDAMALLLYLVEHPDEYQTYKILSEATGIPWTTLNRMIKWHLAHGKENCILHMVASRNGIVFKYIGKPGRIAEAYRLTDHEASIMRTTDSKEWYGYKGEDCIPLSNGEDNETD